MSKQSNSIIPTPTQKSLLKLEKDYFDKLDYVVKSDDFRNDLLSIELEIQLNYSKLASTWNIKNKLQVAAERLVRHHVYMNLMTDIKGVYESPISSDLGIELSDCILCVDCKTVDLDSNSEDTKYTIVESNQISFDNSGHPYIEGVSNLEKRARLTRLPVLTYVIKIIYKDDNVHFNLSKSSLPEQKPTIVLACIPNGELSNLFANDIIHGFKTYKYFTENDNAVYTPVAVPSPLPAAFKTGNQWAETHFSNLGYTQTLVPLSGNRKKKIYHDAANKCYWIYTSDNKQKYLRAIKHGDTMRLNNDFLLERYDSHNNRWDGYKEYDV